MSLTKKVFDNFNVKQVGKESDRVLKFIGSTTTKDRDNDTIDQDGWDIGNYMKNPVFLAVHNYGVLPVGKTVSLQKTNSGLEFDVKFPMISELSSDPNNPSEHAKFADTVYMMYKNNYLNAVSVGFIGKEQQWNEDNKGFDFKQQELLELSAVPIPSNPDALQQAKAKGIDTDVIDKKEIQKDEKFDEFIKQNKTKTLDMTVKLEMNDELSIAFKSLNDELNNVKQALAEMSKQVSFLYNQKQVDEIDIDSIEVPAKKNTDQDELNFEPEELKSIINDAVKSTIENELKKIKEGGN